MNEARVLLFYERLLPGSQLVNRLQDLGYQVVTVTETSKIVSTAKKEKPLFIVMDVKSVKGSVSQTIQAIRGASEIKHLPILCFATKQDGNLQDEAVKAGANLVALDEALLQQMPQLLDHLLQIE
jgi:PleD family two-component response regulator